MFTFLVDGKLHPLTVVPHGVGLGTGLPQKLALLGEKNIYIYYYPTVNFCILTENAWGLAANPTS